MKTETKRKRNLKLRLFFLHIFSFLVSVAPITVSVVINWNKYTTKPSDTVKLCIGGVIALVFVVLKVAGHLKMPRRVVTFGIVFLMSYLLKPVLDDLIFLSGMALLGEAADTLIFQTAIKKCRENVIVDKTAAATTTQIEEVLKKYIGSGRT